MVRGCGPQPGQRSCASVRPRCEHLADAGRLSRISSRNSFEPIHGTDVVGRPRRVARVLAGQHAHAQRSALIQAMSTHAHSRIAGLLWKTSYWLDRTQCLPLANTLAPSGKSVLSVETDLAAWTASRAHHEQGRPSPDHIRSRELVQVDHIGVQAPEAASRRLADCWRHRRGPSQSW